MILQRVEELRKMVELIVFAKEKGMIDHREAKEMWLKCLGESGYPVRPDPRDAGSR